MQPITVLEYEYTTYAAVATDHDLGFLKKHMTGLEIPNVTSTSMWKI